MKKVVLLTLLAMLSGCAPYVDRREIDVFTYACRNDGGINSIGTFPGVDSVNCISGKRVMFPAASKEYQAFLNSATKPEQ